MLHKEIEHSIDSSENIKKISAKICDDMKIKEELGIEINFMLWARIYVRGENKARACALLSDSEFQKNYFKRQYPITPPIPDHFREHERFYLQPQLGCCAKFDNALRDFYKLGFHNPVFIVTKNIKNDLVFSYNLFIIASSEAHLHFRDIFNNNEEIFNGIVKRFEDKIKTKNKETKESLFDQATNNLVTIPPKMWDFTKENLISIKPKKLIVRGDYRYYLNDSIYLSECEAEAAEEIRYKDIKVIAAKHNKENSTVYGEIQKIKDKLNSMGNGFNVNTIKEVVEALERIGFYRISN